jgi:hypothetical protein
MMKLFFSLLFMCLSTLNVKAQVTIEECLFSDSVYQELKRVDFDKFKGKTLDEFLKSHPLLTNQHEFAFADNDGCIIRVLLLMHLSIVIEFIFDYDTFTNRCNRMYWTEDEYRKQKIEKISISWFGESRCLKILKKE